MTRQNKNKAIAIAVTVAVHAIVVGLLFLFALTTPLPLPGEAGVEVNLGMYNEGMGVQQQPKPTEAVEAPKPKQEQIKEETVTQNTEEAPAIEEPKPKEEPKVNERALFKPTTNTTQQPSSEGNTETPGDQGNPNGGQNINNYEGQGGSGGGPSYDLGGRGSKSLQHPSKDGVTEEGTIVVDIWVDRDGRVQNAQIGKGTTIVNGRMRQTALNAAKNSVFAPDSNAAELQKGTITYKFIIGE
ncbi:MAG: TonB family protein [Bacteroidales bacterium]|nr:TonB family protein [Bacteroidales bacterium]